MCVPLPHEQDTNSADTAYEIVCLRILELCNIGSWRGALGGPLERLTAPKISSAVYLI
jgi:hypothetical protein